MLSNPITDFFFRKKYFRFFQLSRLASAAAAVVSSFDSLFFNFSCHKVQSFVERRLESMKVAIKLWLIWNHFLLLRIKKLLEKIKLLKEDLRNRNEAHSQR